MEKPRCQNWQGCCSKPRLVSQSESACFQSAIGDGIALLLSSFPGPLRPSCSLQSRLSRFNSRERSTYRRQGTKQVLNAFLLIDSSTVTLLKIPAPRPLSFDKNFCLKIRKIHVPNRTVHPCCTDPTQATVRLVICKQDTNRALMKRHISTVA